MWDMWVYHYLGSGRVSSCVTLDTFAARVWLRSPLKQHQRRGGVVWCGVVTGVFLFLYWPFLCIFQKPFFFRRVVFGTEKARRDIYTCIPVVIFYSKSWTFSSLANPPLFLVFREMALVFFPRELALVFSLTSAECASPLFRKFRE